VGRGGNGKEKSSNISSDPDASEAIFLVVRIENAIELLFLLVRIEKV
jgi:hypothetical protein